MNRSVSGDLEQIATLADRGAVVDGTLALTVDYWLTTRQPKSIIYDCVK